MKNITKNLKKIGVFREAAAPLQWFVPFLEQIVSCFAIFGTYVPHCDGPPYRPIAIQHTKHFCEEVFEEENSFTLNTRRYNTEEHRDHFILADTDNGKVDFGEGKKNIVALDGTTVLVQNATELPFMVRHAEEVQMAVRQFGKGRGVYISGLPYSFENSRVLYRAVLWSASAENELNRWYSTNYNVEVHAYVKNGKYCVVNNTYEPQDTTVYVGDGTSFDLHLDANEIKWYHI